MSVTIGLPKEALQMLGVKCKGRRRPKSSVPATLAERVPLVIGSIISQIEVERYTLEILFKSGRYAVTLVI